MKIRHFLVAFNLIGLATQCLAANWENGVSGNWKSNHWGMSGRHPGETAGTDSAVINGEGSRVTLSSNLPHPIEELWVDKGGALKIAADLSSSLAKFGCYGLPTTIDQTSGNFSLTAEGVYVGYSTANEVRDGVIVSYHLSGGNLSVENPEAWSLIGNRTPDATALMTVSGRGILNLQVVFIVNGTLEIAGGTTTLKEVGMYDPEPLAEVNSTISMNGSSGSLQIASLKAHAGDQGSATLKYQLDARGVSPIEVTDIALNSGDSDAQFIIDASDWDGRSGLVDKDKLVLIKYKKLWGTFNDSNVTLTEIEGTLLADHDLGNGFKGIVLEVERKP